MKWKTQRMNKKFKKKLFKECSYNAEVQLTTCHLGSVVLALTEATLLPSLGS